MPRNSKSACLARSCVPQGSSKRPSPAHPHLCGGFSPQGTRRTVRHALLCNLPNQRLSVDPDLPCQRWASVRNHPGQRLTPRKKNAPRLRLPGWIPDLPTGGARSRNHKKMAIQHSPSESDCSASQESALGTSSGPPQIYWLRSTRDRFHRVPSPPGQH